MKKSLIYCLLLFSLIIVTSCKNTDKKETKNSEKMYSVEPKTTTINWIAYKTTSKTPVKGQFTKLVIDVFLCFFFCVSGFDFLPSWRLSREKVYKKACFKILEEIKLLLN